MVYLLILLKAIVVLFELSLYQWSYTKKGRRQKKPRMIMKGPLAGFFYMDPSWPQEDVDDIFAKIQEPIAPPLISLIEEDENFIIEKE